MKFGGKKYKNGFKHPGNSPTSNLQVNKEALKKHSNGNGNGNSHGNESLSHIQLLRQKKGLSQRSLAKKLGICKSSLVHFEKKAWEKLTVGELRLLSDVLEIKFEDLLMHPNGSNGDTIDRASLNDPLFVMEYGEGIRISSHLKNPGVTFFGVVTLAPHKTFLREKTPRAEWVSYFVLDGILAVNTGLRDCVLKEGDSLTLRSCSRYELYNPHQFKEIKAVLFTLPSFIQSAS